ncbi:hypothetical protein C2G38_2199977 [Gigaspora rosea]|uniref:Uncharacterized protein n=1 Tax=Gigaspora rosea TaxID=44941 RepID=A0A397UTI0_9GLOM|nr:hypothetical protein C2G38_2199977 [Gigaspora rosea]
MRNKQQQKLRRKYSETPTTAPTMALIATPMMAPAMTPMTAQMTALKKIYSKNGKNGRNGRNSRNDKNGRNGKNETKITTHSITVLTKRISKVCIERLLLARLNFIELKENLTESPIHILNILQKKPRKKKKNSGSYSKI